jgi:hypothetical protein
MWRKILAAVLLAAVMQAEMMAVTGPQISPPQTVPWPAGRQGTNQPSARTIPDANGSPPAPNVASYLRYDHLRRGHEEEVVVMLCKTTRAPGCPFIPLRQTELVPVSLELKPVEGFTVSYHEGSEFHIRPEGQAVQTRIGTVLRLKVRADKNATLGDHLLPGTLTFRSALPDGAMETRQIDIVIPISVVGHDAGVHKEAWSLEEPRQRHPKNVLLIILTFPFWFAELLFFWAWCEFHQTDCN